MKAIYSTSVFTLIFLLSMVFPEFVNAQGSGNLPAGWEYQSTSSNPLGMIIMLEANPRINNIAIEPGDYIGAFYVDNAGNLKCGGADFWLGDENIIFPVFGDDNGTPEKDGFAYAEVMQFKVYSNTSQKSYDVDLMAWDPEYVTSNKWYPLGLSAMIDLAGFVEFDAYAIANPSPVCIGSPVMLSAHIFAGTTGNYTYSWWSEPAGFTSNLPNPEHTPFENTIYHLEVSDGVLTSNHAINVFINELPVVDAGEDLTICPSGCVEINSIVANFSAITWQSTGDGSFNNPNIYNPVYLPGPQDILSGEAILTEMVQPLSACEILASDNIAITIKPIPTIGISSLVDFCESQQLMLDADAENYASIFWTTQGDGTFSNPDSETTQYFPGVNDLALDEFTLNICASAIFPLSGEVCKQIVVNSYNNSSVNAPGSRTKCDNQAISINSVAFNYSSLLWTTDGDGTFSSPEALITSYYAGEQDKINGGAVVTINAFGFGACQVFPATKNVSIILLPSPVVDAGNETVLCSGSSSIQLNAQAEDYAAINWSTSGDGFFTDNFITNPVYYLGSSDQNNGNFTLTLTAYSIYPCTGTVSDNFNVEIVGEPSIEIITESNQTFPLGQALEINASGDDFQSIMWETSGDGTFDDTSALNCFYTPGSIVDASGEPVVLTITAVAADNCGVNVSDQISTIFTTMASVYAGSDLSACEDGAALSGTSQFCNSILWESNGDGTFSNPNSLTANYFPGETDIQTGMAVVSLTGHYGEGLGITDWVNINVVPSPKVEISNQQTSVCFGEVVQLELSVAESFNSLLWYTTNGGGDFGTNGGTTNVYYPSPMIDYPQGCISIFVIASPVNPCSFSSDASLEICFVQNPTADAGSDVTIIAEETVSLTGFASGQSNVMWETSGDGTFDDISILNAEYFPGQEDLNVGNVDLTLTANPSGNCALPATDKLTLTIHKVHSILIPAGWSGFSSYIQSDIEFADLMEPIADELVAAQTFPGIYWPEGGLDNIGNFSNSTGYKIRVNETVVLNITGPETSNKTINLTTGWNLIPVLSSCYFSYSDLIDQLGGDLIIMKEIAGNGVIWPQMYIYNLPVIKPGSAYLVAVAQDVSITFEACGEMKSAPEDVSVVLENNTPWADPEQTTRSHNIAFTAKALSALESGDYIGAFNEEGTCTGLMQIAGTDQNQVITVYGDEALTAGTEGMESGEEIGFKVYRSRTNEAIAVSLTYNTNFASADGSFNENGISVADDIVFKSTNIDVQISNNVNVYPNPSVGVLNFASNDPEATFQLSICDLNGRPIVENSFSGSAQYDLTSYPKGFYIVTIQGENYNKIEKLVLK